MSSSWYIALFICQLSSPLLAGWPEHQPEPPTPFEELAERLSMLDARAVLYDRAATLFPLELRERHSEAIAQVCDARRPIEELEQALRSGNPKVRTLALVALFDREDTRYLPAIIDMIDDTAETFPAPQMAHLLPGRSTPTESQTVGRVAMMMVDFYRTGCRSDLMKPGTPRDVDEVQAELRAWWAVRRDLPYSLSVLRTRRDRVIGRTGRFGRIWQFTNDIRALPPVDNEVVMLCLLTEPHAFEHVDRQTLIYAARRLGPDRLMLMLEGQRLIDDPDYEQSGVDPSSFILEHAADLLRPTDVPRLRALAEAKMDYRYVIAAAELAPKDGVAWLRAALSEPERWWPQDRIAWVLWVLAGDTVADTVSEWFFVPPESYPICPPSRSTFVSELLVRLDASDRRLLARLIDDERFPELDWPTLKRIAAGLNDNLLNTVVDPKALSGLSHPLGECNFHAWVADHPSEYPEKTAVVQAALADWANAIRASRQYLAEPSGGTP